MFADLNPHPLDIVQIILQALQVAAKAKLVGHPIVLKDGAIGLVIGRVAVNISIKCKNVEGKPPIAR